MRKGTGKGNGQGNGTDQERGDRGSGATGIVAAASTISEGRAGTLDRRTVLKRGAAAGLAAPAMAALLGAGVPSAAGAQATPAAGDPAKRGGTFVVLGHQEVASLHPDDAGPTVHFVVVEQMFNALLEMDENFQFNPVLAEGPPEVTEDGLEYTFALRQGVTFHDGAPFTAADVKYTYEWYMDPASQAVNANELSSVAAVETPDERTVVVRLKEPNAAFNAQVASKFIFPAAYHAEVKKEGFATAPVGTGPFKLREWRAAEYTLLEAYDGHFRGRPNFDEFRMNVVPEPSVREIALETGDADSSGWPLVAEADQRLDETGDFTTFITANLAVNHFPLNTTNPVLSDKRVRQAMLHAIDRQAIADDIFGGAATVATGNLSPALEAFYTDDVAQYPFDPERAGALLDEAGWALGDDGVRAKDGQPLTFTCTTVTGDQVRRPEAEVVQQSLREVGIDMQLEEAPVATILERMRSAEMDAALFNWTYGGDQGDPDASVTLRSDGTNNFSQFKNPRVDELLDQGLREIDPAARVPIYQEIQRIVADEVPFLYMLFLQSYNHFSARTKGLPETALSADPLYAKAYTWWFEE